MRVYSWFLLIPGKTETTNQTRIKLIALTTPPPTKNILLGGTKSCILGLNMKSTYKSISQLPLLLLVILLALIPVRGQPVQKSAPKVDRPIIAGLAAVKEKKWAEARANFEEALKIQEKEKLPSEFLFTKIKLPDEEAKEPSDATERQIVAWRHAMGTRQAILAFIAFSSQLEGNAAAAKNFEAVYDFQSVMWGLSWRAFNPPIHKIFHETAPPEKTENYAQYLHNAGELLWSSDDDTQAVKLFEQAQQILPKDQKIAASLASYYLLIDRDAAKAKKQAELSLSVDPKQGRVLIDLATIEWVLGETDAAAKHAKEASILLPNLPGPHATLTFAALEAGDNARALKEAETGDKLSDGHVFYRSILAAALKANGKDEEALKVLSTAWAPDKPDIEQLKKWFFRGKPLEYIEAILKK